MSNFPNDFDDDTTLPFVNDDITEIGGDAINALRDAVVEIEQNIGLGAQGSTASIAVRLGVSFNPDGTIKPSALTALGLVTLPITQDQISNTAEIPESKLRLDHRTQDLFNYIRDLSGDINLAIGWVSVTGIKLEPHLIGAIYRHTLNHINVHADPANFLNNKFRALRNNQDSYTLVNDINNELLAHQWADGSPFGNIQNVVTNNGSVYPSNYAHTASGIFLNTTRFTTIPQTANDLQLFAEFIDGASIFLLGTRIQNLYTNGISRVSRSSSLVVDGYGQNLVPATPAIAYLKNIGNSSSPYDNIDTGDDIIEFKPLAGDLTSHTFDSKFAAVRIGDIIRINYGSVEVPFIIKEKKYSQDVDGNKRFLVRIAGKNLDYAPNAIARVDKPLYNANKYGVLAFAGVNNDFNTMPSLIIGSPRGAQALGIGFGPDEFDEEHYLLYLALYPTGHPQDGYTILPAIDVTGNQGATPGLYTLESIVAATNASFRQNGYNYRFIAFSHQGEFGVMLADPYGNASFSIMSAVIDPDGFLDQVGTDVAFPNNVVDLFPTVGNIAPDPLGFGPFGANLASPPYMSVYGSAEAAVNPTKLFVPLLRNNFYVNGIERERLTLEVGQALDGYGDGYWVAQIIDRTAPSGRVQTTYRIPLDLSASNLKPGKTLVIQSLGSGALVDYGRYLIKEVTFGCNPLVYTDITVYDSVHAKGFSPTATLGSGSNVALYFNSDSVSFNEESSTDYSNITSFKRHFEVFTDQNANTFTHERGRMLLGGNPIDINSPDGTTLYSSFELSKLDLLRISPKLRGYQFGNVTKITLNVSEYDAQDGTFFGRLTSYDGASHTHLGPTVFGRKGESTRFYDETNIDYIDVIFDVNTSVSSFLDESIDIQLFPTLSLDEEIMLLGTCQVDDTNKFVSRIRDERQFGNTSEKDLTTSALNYIALPERLLHWNGVIRGFDIVTVEDEYISLTGGVALVNGNIKQINNQTLTMPRVLESYSFTYYAINWALCVNSGGELITIPLLDYDDVLGTPNAPARIITLWNSASAVSYQTDCISFTDLINNRKDLTILYIVAVHPDVDTPQNSGEVTYKDVRRYVNDQDSNQPIVVGEAPAQRNFANIDTALHWLRFNTSQQNTIAVKGAVNVTEAFNFAGLNIFSQSAQSSMDFASTFTANTFRMRDLAINVTGAGIFNNSVMDNCSLITAASFSANNSSFIKCEDLDFGGTFTGINCNFTGNSLHVAAAAGFNNCTITNIPSTFDSTLNITNSFVNNVDGSVVGLTSVNTNVLDSTLDITGSVSIQGGFYRNTSFTLTGGFGANTNAVFENCSVTITGGSSVTLNNCKFFNCTITCPNTTSITNCAFQNSTINIGDTLSYTNSRFEDCTLTAEAGGYFSGVTIVRSSLTVGGTITLQGNATSITDGSLSISEVRGFYIQSNEAGFTLSRNSITWTGTAVAGYNSNNIVNANDGLIWSDVGFLLGNIQINDNTFTYNMTDRFPFVAFQLTAYNSVLRNVDVCGNKFTSTANANDFRAVVAIVSTLTSRAPIGVFPQFPALVDVHVDNNVCNYDQLIIITGTKDEALGQMNGAAPIATNTTISGNICGTIGYFNGSAGPFDGTNVSSPNNGVVRDKINKLIIDKNTCKFIANLDNKGDYLCYRATRYPNNNVAEEVASTPGDTQISNNSCNWIQVGCGGYTIGSSVVEILNNDLSPFNKSYLNNYTSQTTYQTVTPGNVGILVRRPHNGTDLSASCVISGNNLVQKYTTTANPGVNITNATNASPIVISTSGPHGFAADQLVSISGVSGNTAANGTWTIADSPAPTSTTFALTGSTGNGAFAGGGVAVSTNVYYYDAGIALFNNGRVTNNRISGVVDSPDSPLMYFWDVIRSIIISDNVLERRGLDCKAFFWFDRFGAGMNNNCTIFCNNNVCDLITFGTAPTDRSFLAYTSSPGVGVLPAGVYFMNNIVQTAVNTFSIRYPTGKP